MPQAKKFETITFNIITLLTKGLLRNCWLFWFADFGVVHEITEKEYKAEILRLVSSMPWETPSQNNSYYQPLAEAAMFVYNNWTNGGRKMAQQIIKVHSSVS